MGPVFDGTYGLQPIEGITSGTLAEVERFPDLVEREFWFGCCDQETEDPALGGAQTGLVVQNSDAFNQVPLLFFEGQHGMNGSSVLLVLQLKN